MIAKLSIAAACIGLLASCASTEGANTNGAGNGAMAAAGGKSYYCAKEQLYAAADGFTCNWQPSAKAACEASNATTTMTLKTSQVSGAPHPAGMCKTGEWLVVVAAG
jgi:hypothetical protein